MKFKVGDEILIRGKITTTNCEELHKGHYALTSACVYIDDNFDLHISGDWLNDHATLIDPNEPKNGDRVWVRDIDETSWDKDKYYYVGENPKDSDFVVVDVCGDVHTVDIITTQDPYAKENKPILTYKGVDYSEETLKSIIEAHHKGE